MLENETWALIDLQCMAARLLSILPAAARSLHFSCWKI